MDNVFGFILNVPSEFKVLGLVPLPGKHWLAIKKLGGSYYNLDSKLHKPVKIGNVSNF